MGVTSAHPKKVNNLLISGGAMSITPVQEIFRWRFRKKGTQVLNMCSHFFVFSGSLLALMAGTTLSASANPSGGVVVGGSATISATPTELQIHQHTDRALIEWNNFDIDAGETTRFVQPSITSIALNRVVNSNQVSRINGNLFANGRVIIVNPNGVLIGPNGNVDVAGFVATSADILNSDFMNGSNILTFNRAGNDDAVVENNGRITVAETGIAALVAPTARNNGVINARLAKVHMAGADTFAVDFYGDGLINLSVGAKSGSTKRTLKSENNGTIIADGGVVSMTAADASEVVDSVINNKGTIQAKGLVSRNGEIILTGKGSTVNVSGKIDASAMATGKAGKVKIGGDYQGKGDLARASKVNVTETAIILADAGQTGNGGTIILWADHNAYSRGQFYARGGQLSGNGGLVETSSPLFLDVDGTIVNTLAPFGNAGDWLLDPTNITISTTGSSYVGLPALGNSTVNVSTINNALSNVSLIALNSINFNASVNMLNKGVGLSAYTTFGDINLANGVNIITRSGAVNLDAGSNINLLNNRIDTNGATIRFYAVDDINITNSTLQSDSKNITFDSYDAILNGLKMSTNGGDFTLTANGLFSDLFMDNTIINTTGGINGGVIQVKQFGDGNVTASELGSGNTYSTSPTGKGGKIDIYATVAKNTNNNNCLKAGGTSASCAAVADPVTLTVRSGGTKVYGSADPSALYTLSTSLTGDNAFYGAATRVAGENVGSYAVSRGTLDFAGSTAYNIVYDFTTPFVITQKTLNILANAVSKIYGDADPELTYVADGLVGTDTLTGNLIRNAGQNVGTYAINRGTLSAGNNYAINYVGNNLTINKANLLVKADDKTKVYGSADPQFTVTFDGLKNGDTASLFNVSTTRASGENVGRYEIILSNNSRQELLAMDEISIEENPVPFDVSQNYEINFENGTFIISPKSLIIRADNKTKVFGSVDPALTYSFDGIINGDENGDWRDIDISRIAGEAVGNYDINLRFVKPEFDDRAPDLATQQGERPFPKFFDLASRNYDITFEEGVFSITQTPRTVFPNAPLGALGRPIISLADRIFNQNPAFLPFILSGLNTDVGLLASGGNIPTGGAAPTATNLANIAPDAGDEDPSNVANIEPAAGDEDADQQGDTRQENQGNGSDIDCANSFLDNKPCQDSNI